MELSERQLQQRKERLELKVKLQNAHGLADHPKADLLFDMAWNEGHANGIREVEIYYDIMAELLK